MIIEECNIECIDDVKGVIESTLSWFHAYYATTCIELGRCRAVVCRDKDAIVGVGVFYIVETKPMRIGVIYYVAVEKDSRGRGIGKAIEVSIEELMDMEGIELYIATTRLDNIASRKMLKELGYSEILLEDLDDDVREIIEEVTCAYEDDVLYIKSKNNTNIEQLRGMLLDRDNHQKIRELWNVLCYSPWIKLRRRR